MKIDRHISDLLYCYDCVIIPEFGGFVANYRPARIDSQKHILHPPSKGILFNRNLTHNDGLLANQIAREENRPYTDATLMIRDYVQNCRLTLDEGRRIEINKVGILYYDRERNLQFDADASVNYLQDSFGLASFYVPPLQKAEPEKVIRPVTPVVTQKTEPVEEKKPVDETPVIPITRTTTPKPVVARQKTAANREPEELDDDNNGGKDEPVKKRWGWYVAAAVLLPIVFYSVWIPTQTDALETCQIQASDFNPFHADTAPTYQQAAEIEPIVIELDANRIEALPNEADNTITLDFTEGSLAPMIIRLKAPEIAEPDNTFVDDHGANTGQPETAGLMYHIIGGCFQYLDNAQGLVAELKQRGYNSYIVDQNKGLHRVCYGSYATREEALAAIDSIRAKENSSAWILKKAVK